MKPSLILALLLASSSFAAQPKVPGKSIALANPPNSITNLFDAFGRKPALAKEFGFAALILPAGSRHPGVTEIPDLRHSPAWLRENELRLLSQTPPGGFQLQGPWVLPPSPWTPLPGAAHERGRGEPGGPCPARTDPHPAMGPDLTVSSTLPAGLRPQSQPAGFRRSRNRDRRRGGRQGLAGVSGLMGPIPYGGRVRCALA